MASNPQAALAAAQRAVDGMEEEILRIQSDERELRAEERRIRTQLRKAEGTGDHEAAGRLAGERYEVKSRIADLMSELAEAHNEIHALRQNRDLRAAEAQEAKP